jgi:LmbE family N-acetylglucosaminyl deacetylase
MAELGVVGDDVEIWDFPVRHFPSLRQDILERFVALGRAWAPDLVLLPSSFDRHQDHETVAREGFRAFKRSSIWGYELPQNLVMFENSAFVSLTASQLDVKIKALSCYRSQQGRAYNGEDFIRGLARVRGVQAGVEFAEAFEVIRLIVP